MIIDGNKLRSLRIQKGMSQEKLGILTNLNKRTIQRAESGDPVAIETIAFIADALEVEPKNLRVKQLDLLRSENEPTATQEGEVILVPVTKGSRLVNTLRPAFEATFEYNAEPMENNLALLEEIAEIFNTAWISPWSTPDFSHDGSEAAAADAERIRLQARANRIIPELLDMGIKIFIGSYESWRMVPYYNMDEGIMLVSRNQAPEKVTNTIVVVSDEQVSHLSRMPGDHEVHTAPQSMDTALDDEIPF